MLDAKKLVKLFDSPESTVLDFKAKMYDFTDDYEFRSTAKFVKDILSFCNTVRSDTSFIIIGVEQLPDHRKNLLGIDHIIDDAILQNKIKNKINPQPIFHTYTIECVNKLFGIIEIPIVKYESPLFSVEKMKGVEVGKIYTRHGSSSVEAHGLEIIRINDWLKSLPNFGTTESIGEQIRIFLADLTGQTKKVSIIVADIYSFAKKYKFRELLEFCEVELIGIKEDTSSSQRSGFEYRIQTVFISPIKIDIHPHIRTTTALVRREFSTHKNFYASPLLFIQSITGIEDMIRNLQEKSNHSIATIKMDGKQFFDDSTIDTPVFAYIFLEEMQALYGKIRQKCIDTLMLIRE
jgi:hypothetical protein